MKGSLPRLHAITDARIARRQDLDQVAADLAAGGGSDLAFHARGRSLSGLEHWQLASQLAAYPPSRLFVNDRLDVALAAAAEGVQLGHDSLPVAAARRLMPAVWIGRSVQSGAEAEAARAEGADYLLAGPVFPTATHPDRAPIGLDALRLIAQLGSPVIAIGGVTPERIGDLRAAGAYGVAAIRALWDAADPAAVARRMIVELTA